MTDSYNNYIRRGWTRHEAFADILRRNPPREEYRPGDIVVLMVRFSYGGNTYCYLSKDDIYRSGDLVEVSVRGETKIVTVDSVGYYSEKDFPFRGVGLNTVIGPADGDLADKYRKAIAAEKRQDEDYEKIRSEARAMLEEARRLKAEALRAADAAADANRELIEAALSGLERKMDKVRSRADNLAESAETPEYILSTVRRLNDDYLPKTEKMIAHFREVFGEKIPIEKAGRLRDDALKAIEKTNEVYDNLLAALFEQDMLDMYSEMSALRTMFKREGLTEPDFVL